MTRDPIALRLMSLCVPRGIPDELRTLYAQVLGVPALIHHAHTGELVRSAPVLRAAYERETAQAA